MPTTTAVLLALEGPLTSVLHPDATATELLAPVRRSEASIILDLRAVPSVDCSGIGLLVSLYVAARERGGDLRFVDLRERPRRLLDLCGLLRVFRVFEREEDALASYVDRDGYELVLERTPVGLRREPWWSPEGPGTHLHWSMMPPVSEGTAKSA